MNEPVILSLISAVSGILIAYIVNVAAKKVQKTKSKKQPKDRMEQMFDGYERLIKQKDAEDDRKVRVVNALEEELTATRLTVQRLESALEETQGQLKLSRQENQELRAMLEAMREEYQVVKATKEN